MPRQTKVTFGPMLTSTLGAFHQLPTNPPADETHGQKPAQPKRRRERHPAGDSSLHQNGGSNTIASPPQPPPPLPQPFSDSFEKEPSPNPTESIIPDEKTQTSLPIPEPIQDSHREPLQVPPQVALPQPNRRRRHSSGQRVVRRTRTRRHRPGFPQRKADVLGQMQIICALLIIIVELLLVTRFDLPGHFRGVGFVAGLCFLVSGGLGILSSCTKKSAQLLLCLMVAIIACIVGCFVAVFAGRGLIESLEYSEDDEEIIFQLFYVMQIIICGLEMISAIGQTIVCCCATCCLHCKFRRKETEITVIYATCPMGSSEVGKNCGEVEKKVDSGGEEKGGEDEQPDVSQKEEDVEDSDNDASTSGCDTMIDDDDVLMSNEELNELWVIPRVVRGGGGRKSSTDSKSSDKRERCPSGSSSSKNRNFSGTSARSDPRERNFSGSSGISVRSRHPSGPDRRFSASSSKSDRSYRERVSASISGTQDNPPTEPLVLINYGSDHQIVRSERNSEQSIRGSQPTVHSSRSSSRKDSLQSIVSGGSSVKLPYTGSDKFSSGCEEKSIDSCQRLSHFSIDLEGAYVPPLPAVHDSFLPETKIVANPESLTSVLDQDSVSSVENISSDLCQKSVKGVDESNCDILSHRSSPCLKEGGSAEAVPLKQLRTTACGGSSGPGESNMKNGHPEGTLLTQCSEESTTSDSSGFQTLSLESSSENNT